MIASLIAAMSVLGLVAMSAQAQSQAQVDSLQAPAESYALPEQDIAPDEPAERLLPRIEPEPEPRRPGSGASIRVEAFRFEGNTVFDDDALADVVRAFVGRQISSEDLDVAREALTRHYVDRGYVSSGALIPDQEVTDGVLLVKIVEGRLTDVIVEGTKAFRASYFRQRLMLFANRPLRIQDLEERLQVFQQDDRIRKLASQLGPGDQRGDAILRLQVEEELPVHVSAEWSNDTPVTLGEQTGRLGVQYANLLGLGDGLSAVFRGSEGLREYSGDYRVPMTPWDTALEVHARYSQGKVERGPFQKADIKSQAFTAGLSILQPVWQTRSTTARLALIGDWRRSQTRVDGIPFSFPGSGSDEQFGVSTLTALRFGGEFIHREPFRVVAFRQFFTLGIPILRHTDNQHGVPDGEFFSSLSQLRLALRLPEAGDTELVFRTDAQFASRPLMPLEQIGAGGLASVRGYAENDLVRDNAVVSSFELRIPLYRTLNESHVLKFAPFVDFAHAWNSGRDGFDLTNETILGAGVGLRYRYRRFLRAELYWASFTTDDSPQPPSGQDNGIHFRLRVDLP